jgi:acyl-coenzyme A thioesterase PaaI-like protein
MGDFRERGPIVGLASVVAPPVELRADMRRQCVVGSVCFGPAFEGAPGRVHGGMLAAVLDEALGMATIFAGELCMTGEITLRYRQPTPIGVPLRIAARCDRREGRRIFTSGEILAGDAPTVEARGTFVAVGTRRFSELDAERSRRRS